MKSPMLGAPRASWRSAKERLDTHHLHTQHHLLLPQKPESPPLQPPSMPGVPPKITHQWPEGARTDIFEHPVPYHHPLRGRRIRRTVVYAGARPLSPPVAKQLWFPSSRKLKFSPDQPDYSGQQGAYVGKRPPKVREGPLSHELLEYRENYPFSDMDDDLVV